MRFNTNREDSRRDYEEFSRFLGLNGSRCQASNAQARTTQAESCQHDDSKPSTSRNRSLAMVYPERQAFIMLYDPEIALENGTMFEELNKPFYGGSCKGNNNGEGC